MRRGFLCDRAAKAKAKARAKLEANRRAADPGAGPPPENGDATQAQIADAVAGQRAVRCWAWPERIQLRPGDDVRGGWPYELPTLEFPNDPVWVDDILSDLNLQMFVHWAHAFPDQAEAIRTPGGDRLFYIEHRYSIAAENIRPHVPGSLRQIPCDDEPCERCRSGRGGYRFWWCSALWTPRLCYAGGDAAQVPPNMRRYYCARAAFPWGIAMPAEGDPF